MTTITITGKVRRAIWNLPLTSARVQVALKAIFGETPITYPAETGEPFKVDSSGNINGSGGFDVQVPTVASGNTAQYGFTFLLLDADGETESSTEQTALLNDADTSLSLEDALSGGSAGTGGEIAISGQVYHPFGDGVPYATGTVTVALVTGFITDDGVFPAISADIPIKDGYFNGDVDLVLYVPDGQSEWLFTFPDGTQKTAILGTHTSMVEIADIANGDYATELDPMNPPTSFSVVQDGVDVDITGTDTNSDETGYRIERSDDDGATWEAVTVTGTGNINYTDTNPGGGDYIYRARAEKSGGQSAWATDTVTVILAAPASLALATTGASLDDVLLTWDAVTGATHYDTERSYDNSTWSTLATTTAPTVTTTDAAPDVTQTRVYYRVKARNGGGSSAWTSANISGLRFNARARYSFDSTAWADSIGSATLSGASVTTTTGKLSNAADLSTTNGLSSSDGIYNFTATPFAFLFWLKVNSTPDGFESPLTLSGADFPGAMVLRLFSDQFYLQSGGASGGALVSSPATGTWYSIVAGYDGTNVVGYVNGSSVLSSAVIMADPSGSLSLSGCDSSNAALDELLFIRGRFPTTGQINDYHNGGTGKAYPYNA